MKKKILSICLVLAMALTTIMPAVALAEEIALDDNVYNLVSSFIGDASTSRGFAWTAVDGYEDMVLRYAVSGTADYKTVTPKVVDKGTHLYYKVDVTGLTAGTKYTYNIGKNDKWYGPFEFTTKAAQVDSFSFIGVSDPQGKEEVDYSIFEADIDAALQDAPDASFIVNLGDLVDYGYNEDQWRWHFNALKGHCENVPYMGVAGNHDVEDPAGADDPEIDKMWGAGENFSLHFNHPDNAKELMNSVSSADMENQKFKDMFDYSEDLFYSFDYGNAHFTVLSAVMEGISDNNDRLNYVELQQKWLEKDLSETDAKWKIVLLHVGAYPADTKESGTLARKYFTDIIDQYGVDLVLQGHDHLYARSYPMLDKEQVEYGTVYTVLGASADKRYGDNKLKGPGWFVEVYKNTDPTQPVYTVFNVNDERIQITAKQLDGTVLDTFELKKPTFDESIIGDISSDGDVNAADVLMLAKYVARYNYKAVDFSKKEIFASDVNKDEKVSSEDLLNLVKYCAGIITEF